jgi:hypothetical protein
LRIRPWGYNAVTRSRCCFAVVLLFGVWPFGVRKACADAFAHPNGYLHPAQESNFNLEGKVTQKSEGKLTVSTEENILFHVRYDEKTDIRLKDGAQGSDKDLKTGLKVRVQGEFSKSGEILAHKIQVL